MTSVPKKELVGPVFESGAASEAVLAAIQRLNPEAELQFRGSYVRVLVPGRCVLTRDAVEQESGRPFRLPGDLERLMPAFRGLFTVNRDQAVWSFEKP